MADEISLTAALRISSTNLRESYDPGAITIDYTDADSTQRGGGGLQNIGTAVEAISLGDAADGGVFFFRNVDDVNYVEIGRTSDGSATGTFYPFLKLLAGEPSVGRLSESTIFARANTASINLQYRMLSP